MRRFTAIILVAIMLAASILPIYAEGTDENIAETYTDASGNKYADVDVIHSQGSVQPTGPADFGGVPIKYGVSEGFIVTIPNYIPLLQPKVTRADDDDDPSTPSTTTITLNPTSVNLSASQVFLPMSKTLVIYLSGSYSNGAWKLTSQEEGYSHKKIDYVIARTRNGNELSNYVSSGLGRSTDSYTGDVTFDANHANNVLVCPGGTAAVENTIYFAVTGKPELGGTYLDTITFNVEPIVVSAS